MPAARGSIPESAPPRGDSIADTLYPRKGSKLHAPVLKPSPGSDSGFPWADRSSGKVLFAQNRKREDGISSRRSSDRPLFALQDRVVVRSKLVRTSLEQCTVTEREFEV